MRFVFPVLLAVVAACAPNPQTSVGGNANYEAAAAPLEGEIAATASLYREPVRRSERIGRAIYQKDYATAFATEMLAGKTVAELVEDLHNAQRGTQHEPVLGAEELVKRG